MKQLELFVDNRSLFEKLCSPELLLQGFKAVRKNRGAPGIDGVTIDAFEQDLEEELARLNRELVQWSYKPKPVRRVEISKPGKDAGVRLLGVPCVRDRVVQATLKLYFSRSDSFGIALLCPSRPASKALTNKQEINQRFSA